MAAFYAIYHWKLSDLFLAATPPGLAMLEFIKGHTELEFVQKLKNRYRGTVIKDPGKFAQIISLLDGYFSGEIIQFPVALDLSSGTAFQREVWSQILKIPYGQTRTYIDIARELGNPGAVRAVGTANGKNPVAIVVPCHRVIRTNGNLGGYGGGLEIKDYLLRLEGAII